MADALALHLALRARDAPGRLPGVRLPALFVHGIDDPLPLRSSSETARLIPGARVDRVSRAGHFPWLEQPGFLERTIRGLV